MSNVFFFLAGAACLVTLGVLAFGIGGFGTGKITPQGQNKLMRWRIIAQFVAIILIMLTIFATRSQG